MLIFLFSALWITLAEMGDKTQLLAMAFATRYKAWQVLVGVFLATVFNHALAVAAGSLLTQIPGFDAWIQTIAAVSFLGFGLWTIHGDHLEGEDKKISKYGAVPTVAIAFFLAEMGDKTQLMTISLAAEHPQHPVLLLLGTTTGMLVADAFGIIVGVVMHRHIPERLVKLLAAGAFILFGLIKTWEVLTTDDPAKGFNWNHGVAGTVVAALALASLGGAILLIRAARAEKTPEPEMDREAETGQ